MDSNLQHSSQTPMSHGIPHNVADLILTHAMCLAALGSKVETAYRHDDGFPEPNDADDAFVDVLRTCLMVAPDLPLAQQAAVVRHPDMDIVELCGDGDLLLVRAWFTAMNRNNALVLDSLMLDCITAASAGGHVHVLDWLHRYSHRRMFYSADAMDETSAAGRIQVLQWWLDSGLKLRYSEQAMDGASGNGHVDVLAWWAASGLQLKYTEDSMDLASADDRVECLKWWKESQLECKYSESALYEATAASAMAVLNWWKDSGLGLKYEAYRIVQLCTNYGRVDCFEWWVTKTKFIPVQAMPMYLIMYDRANCLLDEYWAVLQWRVTTGFSVHAAMYNSLAGMATEAGRLDVLDWWSGANKDFAQSLSQIMTHAASVGQLEVIEWAVGRLRALSVDNWKGECGLVHQASMNGHLHVLEWWKESGLDLPYTTGAIENACAHGHLAVVKWWAASGLECRYTCRAVDKAAGNGHVAILQWLHEQPPTAPIRFTENYSCDAMDQASCGGHVAVLQFFVDTGREIRCTSTAMDGASKFGHIHVLDWWLAHQGRDELKWTREAVSAAPLSVPVLQWWDRSGLGLDLNSVLRMGEAAIVDTDTVQWLKDSGYAVPATPRELSQAKFELIEYLVTVVGLKPTSAWISQLQAQGEQDHVIEWMQERMEQES